MIIARHPAASQRSGGVPSCLGVTIHSAAGMTAGSLCLWGLRERKTVGKAAALFYGVDAQSKRLERVLHESHHGGGVPSDIDAQREG